MSITRIIGENDNYLFDPENRQATLRLNGKFGNVYAGFRESDNIHVVIKHFNPLLLQHPAALLQFKFEADVKQEHPNLRKTFEFISIGENNFLIQEYVNGTEIKKVIRQEVHNTDKILFVVRCCINVLEALEYLHPKNIIHCDIKPANILIDSDNDKKKPDIHAPAVKLIDFGNAKTALSQFLTMVKPFSMIYSPPEQVLHAYDLINPSSDLFSLAITAYELIAGEIPYTTNHPEMLLHLQVSGEIPENKNIPDQLFSILKKATGRRKFRVPPNQIPRGEQLALIRTGIEERYVSATEMKNDLMNFLNNHKQRKSIFSRIFK